MSNQTDFLGNKLSVGDYIVVGGAGNRAAEYGSILYQLLDLSGGKIRAERLYVHYNWHNEYSSKKKTYYTIEVTRKASTLKKINKMVKVTPSPGMVKVFKNPEDYDELVGKWLHGVVEINWKTLQYEEEHEDA